MIRVKYVEKDGQFISLEVKGHANSTTIDGHDIICAGVSACVVGAMNALEDHKKFEFIMEDGHVLIKKIDDENLSIHNQIVLQTLLVQLKTIEESNKKFIKIN